MKFGIQAILFTLMLLNSAFLSQGQSNTEIVVEQRGPPQTGYPLTNESITITGNSDLQNKATTSGWTGTGTESDPIVI